MPLSLTSFKYDRLTVGTLAVISRGGHGESVLPATV